MHLRIAQGLVIACALLAAEAAQAGGHGEIGVGHTLGNRLIADLGFAQPIQLPRSIYAGFPGYATALVGFANVDLDAPDQDVYRLSLDSSISVRLVGADPGAALYNGLTVMQPGDSLDFGPPFFDFHPIFSVPSPGAVHGPVRALRLVLHDASGIYADSEEFTIGMTPACPGDFNLSNSIEVQDIFDFINAWFEGQPTANFNQQNGLEVQDIFGFLSAWFAGCA